MCRSAPGQLCTAARLWSSTSARSQSRTSVEMETQGQANIFKRVFFLFDLFVDGLGDGVALLLGALLALGLVLRAAHPVLHRLTLLPVHQIGHFLLDVSIFGVCLDCSNWSL